MYLTRWCLILFFVAGLIQTGRAEVPPSDRCVVLVSVDGLANFYLDDPQAEMPTLRRLIREGARAQGLVCSFPTVTWPNHTTLVTGVPPARHGVIGNNYLDRKSATPVALIPDPLFDKDEIVKSPTIYDVAHRAGLVTAGIIWPATRNARTLDWTVPDMGGNEAWPKYGTAAWMKELKDAGVPIDRHGSWVKEPAGGVQRDWLYTRLAAHLFKHHAPNLLLIHLVEVDHVEHRFGPRSPEAYWAVSFADDRLRDLIESSQRSQKKTTFIVASDHGFFPIEKEIRPNVALKKQGFIVEKKKLALCLPQGGACMVYVLDDEHRTEIVAALRKSLPSLEGVRTLFGPEEFQQLGQSTPKEDARAPDLWLTAKSGYSFSDSQQGEDVVVPLANRGGTHGYVPEDPDLYGTLVLWGYGIKPGVDLGKVSNLDVAPTMAKLLDVELPGAAGRVLTSAVGGPDAKKAAKPAAP